MPESTAVRAAGAALDAAEPAARIFANGAAVSRSWYPVLRSRRLRAGRIRAVALGGRPLAAFRDSTGTAHVLDARCPHLGADLCQGSIVEDGLRCALHGWSFGPDGRCRHAPPLQTVPDRRTRAYPVIERWGFIWLFNGLQPLFPLPGGSAGAFGWTVRLPPQRLRCHPHLVLANGLDLSHYEGLHGMRFSEVPRLQVGPFSVSVTLRGRPVSRAWRLLSGSTSRDIVAEFTAMGGSLAWTTVSSPIDFDVLFTGRPLPDGGCLTQTIFFFRERPGAAWLRALGLMATLLRDDRRVLERMRFRPAFVESDEPLRAYARLVDALGAW